MAPISRSEFKRQIQEMDPTRFEHFVADLWSGQGWNTRVTQEKGDRGIDIVATMDNPVSEKHLIQAKRYGPNNPVGSPDVQQYSSLRQQEQAVDAVVIVTSGRFSEQAERVARDLNVKLVDGDGLYDLCVANDLFDTLQEYLPSDEIVEETAGQSKTQPTSFNRTSASLAQSETDGGLSAILPSDKWWIGILLAIGFWETPMILRLLGIYRYPSILAGIGFFVMFVGIALLFVSVFQDIKHVRETTDQDIRYSEFYMWGPVVIFLLSLGIAIGTGTESELTVPIVQISVAEGIGFLISPLVAVVYLFRVRLS